MPKLSAGLLVYRVVDKEPQVLLVHPGGPFWAKKDTGAWSLPKGEYTDSEDPEEAARREFKEETGLEAPTGEYRRLGEVKYGNKILTAWATVGDYDVSRIKSNYFEMQWPPKSGKTAQFPEVDKAGWFSLALAKNKLVSGQLILIDMLAAKLGVEESGIEDAQPRLF